MVVADAKDAIFGPAIDAGASVVVGKVSPGLTVRTVVLAYGAPGAFGEVRAPAFPVFEASFGFAQANVFRRIGIGHGWGDTILTSERGEGLRTGLVWMTRPRERNEGAAYATLGSAGTSSGRLYLHSPLGLCANAPALRY